MIACTHCDLPFMVPRQPVSACAVSLTLPTYTGGGDTFDCYAPEAPEVTAVLTYGSGWSAPWVLANNYTGWGNGNASGLDTFESYTDGDTLGGKNGGSGWASPWVAPSETSTNPGGTPPTGGGITPGGGITVPATGQDTFDGYVVTSGPTIDVRYNGQLAYTGWADWEIMQGSADLLGLGFKDVYPGNGQYMHLGANPALTGSSALTIIRTKATFSLFNNALTIAPASETTARAVITAALQNPNVIGQGTWSLMMVPDGVTPGVTPGYDWPVYDWNLPDQSPSGPEPASFQIYQHVTKVLATPLLGYTTGITTPVNYRVWIAVLSTKDAYAGIFLKNLTVNLFKASIVGGGVAFYYEDPIVSLTIGNENPTVTTIQPPDPLVAQAGTGWIGPWVANVPALSAIVISPTADGTQTFPLVVTMTSVEGAAIHYTTDGSTPTSASALYAGAITLGAAAIVKAIGVLIGWDSPVAAMDYTIPFPTAGLVAWWKADALALADGDPVAMWPDSSSGGLYPASQSTSGARPTFKTAIYNGKPTVRFDNVNDGMVSSLTPALPLTVIAVYTGSPDGSGHRAIAGSNNWLMGPYGGFHKYYNSSFMTGGAVVTGVPVVASVKQVTGQADYWVNGTHIGSNGNNTTPGTVNFAASGAFAEKLNGDLCEVLVFSQALSDTNRGLVESYLRTKYGI